MQAVTTIGLDIAKSVFQVTIGRVSSVRGERWSSSAGQVIIRRQLKRRYVRPFFERLPVASTPCIILDLVTASQMASARNH
jgi:transposase